MPKNSLDLQIEQILSSLRLTPKKVITTIFGDMLHDREQDIWLTSLVKVTNLFGFNDAQSRTAALRLVKDGWFTKEKVGRNTYYSLSSENESLFERYYNRVYSSPKKPWSGKWIILIVDESKLKTQEYAEVRQELFWLGAGQLAPYIFVLAQANSEEIQNIFFDKDLADKIQIMESQPSAHQSTDMLERLSSKAWNLKIVSKEYQEFLDIFTPVYKALRKKTKSIDGEQAFLIRTLLIYAYRRLVLRDPGLPEALLPENWHGHKAYTLCSELYSQVFIASESYISIEIDTKQGALPKVPNSVYDRFGGILKNQADRIALL